MCQVCQGCTKSVVSTDEICFGDSESAAGHSMGGLLEAPQMHPHGTVQGQIGCRGETYVPVSDGDPGGVMLPVPANGTSATAAAVP